jgi:hypothetical protein
LLAVAMMGLSLALPWYNVSFEESSGDSNTYNYHENRDYSLHGRELALEEKYASYDEMVLRQSDSWRDWPMPGLPQLYSQIQNLMVLGLISASLLVVGAVFLPAKRARYLLLAPCALIIIAGMAAPLYHLSENPDAMGQDRCLTGFAPDPRQTFSGQAVSGGLTRTWGPAAGWYLSFFGAFFGSCAMVLLLWHMRAGWTGQMSRPASALVASVVIIIAGTSLSFHLLAVEQQGTENAVDDYLGSEQGDPVSFPYWTVTRAVDGDWVLAYSGGGPRVSEYIYLQIMNVNTGEVLLDAKLTTGTETNPNFHYFDGSQNGLLDWPDTITLHATINGQPNPNVAEGSRVVLIKGNNIISTIKLN